MERKCKLIELKKRLKEKFTRWKLEDQSHDESLQEFFKPVVTPLQQRITTMPLVTQRKASPARLEEDYSEQVLKLDPGAPTDATSTDEPVWKFSPEATDELVLKLNPGLQQTALQLTKFP